MVFLLRNLDALIPSMQLLIHSHGFFNFIMLNQDSFGFMELFIEYSKLCLDSEVVYSLLGNEFVDLSEIICL